MSFSPYHNHSSNKAISPPASDQQLPPSVQVRHTMGLYSTLPDSENFWKVAASDTSFWDAYVSTRPHYSPSFYSLLYAHHAAHSTNYTTVHDVGCGAGQVAAELAAHFTHVVASDNDADHLSVAKNRLGPTFPSSRITYTHSKAEDLAAHHPVGSADMIAAAEVMVLTDAASALVSFANILKPGGTLATWFYGRPTFSDAELFAKGQGLIDQIMVHNWTKVIQGSGPLRRWGYKRCADGMESWLDFVDFPTDTWKDVQRIKWNTHSTLPFFGKEACGWDIEPVSNVKEGENVIVKEDPDFWMNMWDLAALKAYFSVLFPGFREAIGEGDEEIDRLFKELGEVMGGDGVTRQFTWPCVLLLATRR